MFGVYIIKMNTRSSKLQKTGLYILKRMPS